MKEGSRITKSEENKKCSCFPYCMRIAVFCMVMLVSVVTLIPHAVCADKRIQNDKDSLPCHHHSNCRYYRAKECFSDWLFDVWKSDKRMRCFKFPFRQRAKSTGKSNYPAPGTHYLDKNAGGTISDSPNTANYVLRPGSVCF